MTTDFSNLFYINFLITEDSYHLMPSHLCNSVYGYK